MAYTNFTNCTKEQYESIIYSEEDTNRIRIWFNNVELLDADEYCKSFSGTNRILPDDGNKIFTLDNFVAKNYTLILRDLPEETIIADQVRISIGTLVNENNNTYEDVPIGIFNIQDTPINDKGRVTIKLRDNRVKFDFNYNAQPLIESLGGTATKKQILEDICNQAGVTNNVSTFDGEDDEIGIYDNTITATTYVSYIFEQAGLMPFINREGQLDKINLNDLKVWRIPLSIVEKYEKGTPFKIERVVYESGIIKYESSNDETLDTLYLNSANPYINNKQQIDNIYNLLVGFSVDSVKSGKILGNPAIDPFDMILIYDDEINDNPISTSTGTNLTLENTPNASTNIDLLGNTTQNGTPTPSSPIPVNVVSGDNEINVVGKNLLDTTQPNVVNFTSNWDKSAMPLNNNLVLKAGSYTMSLDIKSASGKVFNKIIFVDVDNNEYTWTIYVAIPTTYTSYNHTFTFNNDIVVKRIDYQNGGDGSETFYLNNIQLEKGSSATAYEPYQGNTYNIDLPVENLFDKDNANYVNGWIDSTTMRLNTNNGNRMFYISCKPNTTYTISRSIITSSFRTTTYDNTPFPIATGSNVDYTVGSVLNNNNGTTLTITTGANAKYLVVHYGKVEDTNLNETLATIQVEYGNKANTYTPYGTTPIELCKIGTYQDRIFKSSGKNILDLNGTSGTLAGITYTITNNGVILNGTANADAYIRLATYTNNEGNIFNNKKFTITETKTGLLTYTDYYENNTWKASQNASVNGTTLNISYPETRIILKISSGTALNNYILFPMISDDGGSYEPYGNYWYKYNAIGKVVLDGTITPGFDNSGITGIKMITYANNNMLSGNYIDGLTNYFYNKKSGKEANTIRFGANNTNMYIYVNESDFANVNAWKTWLSTHNTIVYYVLATPTYTKIENDELIGQLNRLKTIQTVEGTTNIQQDSSSSPFELNVEYFNESYILKTLANNTYKYTGINRNEFNTEISLEQRKENVSIKSEATYQKIAKTEIDAANASISMITGELGIVDGQSQVINGIIQYQDKNSAIIKAISSSDTTTDENGNIVPTGVKTEKGFTFDKNGLNITSSDNTYKTQIDEQGTYYYDGSEKLGETTKEGSKFKNMDLYGEFHYGMDKITDNPLFVSLKFSETNNGTTEQCFGHFWNGD